MIVRLSDLPTIRKKHKDQKVVLVTANFDILHRGHVEMVNKAKKLGDILVVAVKSNNEVAAKKGPNLPINGQVDRSRVVDGLKAVDYTVVSPSSLKGELPVLRVIKSLQPDIFATRSDAMKKYRKTIEEMGVTFHFDHSPKTYLSSQIITRISDRFHK